MSQEKNNAKLIMSIYLDDSYNLTSDLTHRIMASFREHDGREYCTARSLQPISLTITCGKEKHQSAYINACNIHSAAVYELKEITKQIEKIAKNHTKYVEKHGRALSAGQAIMQWAIANKIETIELSLPKSERVDYRPTDAAWHIDNYFKNLL